MKKKNDAVKVVRQIRDKMYAKTKKMSPRELLEFYRQEAAKVHSRINIQHKVLAR